VRWIALATLTVAMAWSPQPADAQACPPDAAADAGRTAAGGTARLDRCLTLGDVLRVPVSISPSDSPGRRVQPGSVVPGAAQGSSLQPMQAALGMEGAGPIPGQVVPPGTGAPGVPPPAQPGPVPGQPATAPGIPAPAQPPVTGGGLPAAQAALRTLVFDRALTAAYAPIESAPERPAFARSLPPNAPIAADPRTISIVLHTDGPLSGTDDRVLTSGSDATFTALPAAAYGPQPPPPPCRGGLIYTGAANARAGALGTGLAAQPIPPASMVTGDGLADVREGACRVVTYTIRAEE
jgi:hypothetical protein